MNIYSITRADMRRDLQAMLQRQYPEAKKRQENFNDVELLLCYGLFYIVNPHKYGGANIDKVPDDVKKIAAFCKRTSGSITNKMLNLDGSRSNSGKDEVQLFAQLSMEQQVYCALYKDMIEVAREIGISNEQLPDFLGEFDVGEKGLLLSQDELPSSNSELLKVKEAELEYVARTFALEDRLTEKTVEQKVRLAQHRFAADVMRNYAHRCVFCGFAPWSLLKGHGLLRASHIKPWAKCEPKEQVDVHNGVVACPMHDAGFDRGYISFDERYAIVRSRMLMESVERDPVVGEYFERNLRDVLLVPSRAVRPAQVYIKYHQEFVFRDRAS